MVPVFGEPLLRRTIRQFRERIPDSDVYIPIREPFQLEGIERVEQFRPPDDQLDEAHKLLSSVECWDPDDRTILVFGDVCFTDYAVDTITATTHEIRWFGRRGANRYTGCPHPELFGLSFLPTVHRKLLAAAETVREGYNAGKLECCKAWTTYVEMEGISRKRVRIRKNLRRVGPTLVSINDKTDDFDRPSDYENWLKAT
jgi:hypothetical protein